MIAAKICGLNDAVGVDAATRHGASFLGFVFFPPSPRNVAPELAAGLMHRVPTGIVKVGLFVDPSDEFLQTVLHHAPLDLIQLHGKETPARTAAIRKQCKRPVMKALPLAGPQDLQAVKDYADIADRLLFDAPPPQGATRPGGNANSFDWTLLANLRIRLPWMLAGGLTPSNLAEAVRTSGAKEVDVSSGVEDAPGKKNPDKIRAFLELARTL
ncbi:MAG: phosphoribosylanthranilate isomerase [Alphaproteobacteria bacterium]|nr:phosphoribosylanthranilate isomerase [Alphaproteobacteria bacterium]